MIFTSQRTEGDRGYSSMADRMLELAAQQPGFLGVESVHGTDGFGITVSYWRSLEDVRAWRNHSEHLVAQDTGKRTWYSDYGLRICEVQRAYPMASTGDIRGETDSGMASILRHTE